MQPAAVSLPLRVPSTITAALVRPPKSLLDLPWAARSMGVGMSPKPKALNVILSSLLSTTVQAVNPAGFSVLPLGGRPITTYNGLQWAFVLWTYTGLAMPSSLIHIYECHTVGSWL